MPQNPGKSALKPVERFTIAQWRAWPDDERWELIGGIAYNMSTAPRRVHQKVAGR